MYIASTSITNMLFKSNHSGNSSKVSCFSFFFIFYFFNKSNQSGQKQNYIFHLLNFTIYLNLFTLLKSDSSGYILNVQK